VQYKELARGRTGRSPLLESPCECHFESFLCDGTPFDSSYARGGAFEFVPSQMIQGWTICMQLMGEGDTWEVYVPPSMAYGDVGLSSEKRGQFVPPGAVLVFVLTLVQLRGPSRPKLTRPPPGHAAATQPQRQRHEASQAALGTASVAPPAPPLPPLPETALITAPPIEPESQSASSQSPASDEAGARRGEADAAEADDSKASDGCLIS